MDSLNLVYRVGQEAIISYYGETRFADIILPTQNSKYSIGFVKTDGAYELIADWYGIKDFSADALLKKITQRYSYLVITDKLSGQGFEVMSQNVDSEEQIRITLRRG